MDLSQPQVPPDIVISCSPERQPTERASYDANHVSSTSTKKERILEAIKVLMQSGNGLPQDQVIEDFLRLKNLVLQDGVDGRWLKREGIVKKILSCLENSLMIVETQKIGLLTIQLLLLKHASLQSLIQDDLFVQQFLQILKKYEDDIVLTEGLSLATDFTSKSHNLLRRKPCTWDKHMQTLCVDLVNKFKDNLTVLTASFTCLLAIHEIPAEDACEQFILEHRCKWLLDAIGQHLPDLIFILLACKLVRRLITEHTIDMLVDDGAPTAVIKCFKKYYLHEEILHHALDILLCLLRREVTKCLIIQSKVLEDLLSALMKFLTSTSTQAKGFQLFGHMAEMWVQNNGDNDEVEQWLKQIYWAMAHHREDVSVQIACCKAVSALLEFSPGLKNRIGEDTSDGQVPIHTVTIGCLFMHDQNPDVFEAVCNAIYWVTADKPEMQELMMEKNIFIAVQLGMRMLRGCARALAAGCKALRGMCIFNEEYKERIAWHAMKEVMRAFWTSCGDIDIHVESLATLACLADTELVRNKCMVEQVHERIVKYMIMHINSPLFQEVALEALAVLCAADDGPRLLNEINTLTRVVDAMTCHEDDQDIQRKCLVLIQLLSDGQHLLDHLELSSHLASCVVDAMMKHRHAAGVQTEGCVAMQILAECCDEMGNHLVNCKAHVCLFYILEEYNNDLACQNKLPMLI